MKLFIISVNNLNKIKEILSQYGGPVQDNSNSRIYNDLNPVIVNDTIELISKRENLNKDLELTSIEYFALIRVLDYFLLKMGIYEFGTVTGLDYYEDGIVLLNDLRRQFIGLPV